MAGHLRLSSHTQHGLASQYHSSLAGSSVHRTRTCSTGVCPSPLAVRITMPLGHRLHPKTYACLSTHVLACHRIMTGSWRLAWGRRTPPSTAWRQPLCRTRLAVAPPSGSGRCSTQACACVCVCVCVCVCMCACACACACVRACVCVCVSVCLCVCVFEAVMWACLGSLSKHRLRRNDCAGFTLLASYTTGRQHPCHCFAPGSTALSPC